MLGCPVPWMSGLTRGLDPTYDNDNDNSTDDARQAASVETPR